MLVKGATDNHIPNLNRTFIILHYKDREVLQLFRGFFFWWPVRLVTLMNISKHVLIRILQLMWRINNVIACLRRRFWITDSIHFGERRTFWVLSTRGVRWERFLIQSSTFNPDSNLTAIWTYVWAFMELYPLFKNNRSRDSGLWISLFVFTIANSTYRYRNNIVLFRGDCHIIFSA